MIRDYAALIGETGILSSLRYTLYRAGVKSGVFERLTPVEKISLANIPHWIPDHLPDLGLAPDKVDLLPYLQADPHLLPEADQILSGNFLAFGSQLEPIDLIPHDSVTHWTKISDTGADGRDIKLTWEPARFVWAITLARAYLLTGDERYPAQFWSLFESFLQHNPVNAGSNWLSGQEAALRLINLSLAAACMTDSTESTPNRIKMLNDSLVQHVKRIIPTVVYARAQNNNHILSEAAGLYTAGTMCNWHPDASKWRRQGLRLFNQAVFSQVDENGEYVQHSTNYHRLMLYLSLWMQKMTGLNSESLAPAALELLNSSVLWLYDHTDRFSGQASNLGHNDGTNLFALSSCAYSDYRPVLQAGGLAFLQNCLFKAGPWDELCLWVGVKNNKHHLLFETPSQIVRNHRLDLDETNWASMRVARYQSRPAHADMLHVDIWKDGINLACDPGSYRYTAPAPWENGLRTSKVHNTLTIDRMDQMKPISRFRWINWAQADRLEYDQNSLRITASHNGYRQSAITHTRTLEALVGKNGWAVIDRVSTTRHHSHPVTLYVHWLLPDYPFQAFQNSVRLFTPTGGADLIFSFSEGSIDQTIYIHRAGKRIDAGEDDNQPLLGWYSGTYNQKAPALSVEFVVSANLPAVIHSQWVFGNDETGNG